MKCANWCKSARHNLPSGNNENGIVVGYGGDRYTRSDVVKLLKLKDTFAPYVDLFSRDSLDANGNPAAKAEEVKAGLNSILADLQKALA